MFPLIDMLLAACCSYAWISSVMPWAPVDMAFTLGPCEVAREFTKPLPAPLSPVIILLELNFDYVEWWYLDVVPPPFTTDVSSLIPPPVCAALDCDR